MERTAAIAMAESLKTRLTQHLLAGYKLRATGLGLEQYNNVTRFNIIADHMLNELAPQVVSQEAAAFANPLDMEHRVVSLEGILDRVKAFLSGTKGKEVAPVKSFFDEVDWATAHLHSAVAAYTPKETSFPLNRAGAAFFGSFTEVPAITKALLADVKGYDQLFKKHRAPMTAMDRALKQLEKDAAGFVGNVDHHDEIVEVLNKATQKAPKSVLATMSLADREVALLGYPDGIADSEAFTTDHTPTAQTAKGPVVAPTGVELKALASALEQLLTLYKGIEDYFTDINTAIDGTDAPWRGYAGESDTFDTACSESPFFQGFYDDQNTDFFYLLIHRLERLGAATIALLRQIVA